MTTRYKLKSMLIDKGMSGDQAEEVMKIGIPELDNIADGYKITWDRPASEYQESIHQLLLLAIKPIALKWIDENKPHAWFRAMFI